MQSRAVDTVKITCENCSLMSARSSSVNFVLSAMAEHVKAQKQNHNIDSCTLRWSLPSLDVFTLIQSQHRQDTYQTDYNDDFRDIIAFRLLLPAAVRIKLE